MVFHEDSKNNELPSGFVNITIENGPVEIVDFPIKHGEILDFPMKHGI